MFFVVFLLLGAAEREKIELYQMSEDESEQDEEEEEDEEQMNEGPVAEESRTLHLRVGQSRGLPCTIHYELYGTGQHKILFIMGKICLFPPSFR